MTPAAAPAAAWTVPRSGIFAVIAAVVVAVMSAIGHLRSVRPRAGRACLTWLAVAGFAALAQGCTTLPHPPGGTPSSAITDFAQTPMGKIAAPLVPGDGRSAFRLMPFAAAAYATRIEMAALATRSLDLQYYYFPGDNSGKFMMRALRNAAERGVRVRLLIDDLYTAGEDPLLLSLASFPNVEIRLFNPFADFRDSLVTRFLGAFDQLGRVNHRMHNKLFIADNAMAVAGGRNLADEYFMRSVTANFVDIDTFIAGPLVRDLSALFDRYWNSDFAYPLYDIVQRPTDVAAEQRKFDELTIYTIAPPPDPDRGEAMRKYVTLPDELKAGHIASATVAPAEAFADPLSKAAGANLKTIQGTVTDRVERLIDSAQHDVLVISPYFVPGPRGIALMHRLTERGISQTVVTNSLASTDEPIVHGAYIRYRLPMLQAGVHIRELSPTLVRTRMHFGQFGESSGALHAKVVVVDHARLFIGSMNLDERSAFENTELGIIIDSPELANEFLDQLDPDSSYTLRLGPTGDIEWVEHLEGHEVVFTEEPEVSWWLRLQVFLLEPFVPEKDL